MMTLITDASWNPNIKRGGVGWILYYHQITIIQAGQNFITNEWSISFLEAHIIFYDLAAIQGNIGKIQIFSNCLVVLKNHSMSNLELCQLILHINLVARSCYSVSFIHVNRSIVHIDDKLAPEQLIVEFVIYWNSDSSIELYYLFN